MVEASEVSRGCLPLVATSQWTIVLRETYKGFARGIDWIKQTMDAGAGTSNCPALTTAAEGAMPTRFVFLAVASRSAAALLYDAI